MRNDATRNEARWDCTADALRDEAARLSRSGARVVALSARWDGAAARYAAVFAHGAAREQRLQLDIPLERVATVLAVQAREGFSPVRVCAVNADRARLALVFERARTSEGPRLVGPWSPEESEEPDAISLPHRDPAGDVVVSLAAIEPLMQPPPGRRLLAIVEPRSGPRVTYALRLDDGERWVDSPWAPALGGIARPVAACPMRRGGRRRVLSLWRDERLEPWSTGDPQAPTVPAADDHVPEGALSELLARRLRDDGRAPQWIAAEDDDANGAVRYLILYGGPGRDAPLPRSPSMAGVRGQPPPCGPSHPLATWMLGQMEACGARHGQLVVTRGRELAYASAFGLAEEGYPPATLDHAMRLGSVSKLLTSIALHAAIDAGRLAGTQQRVLELLGIDDAAADPQLARLTVRDLLVHAAGLHASLDIRPDDEGHPLAEDALARALGRVAPLGAGDVAGAVAALGHRAFARAPGIATRDALEGYSNEGYMLLGEMLARHLVGRRDGYEELMAATVLRPVGVEPGPRGCLLGAGRHAALARAESPPQATVPRVVRARFSAEGSEGTSFEAAPYAMNGPLLGAAVGICIPLMWLARVLAGLGPYDRGASLWTRGAADRAALPVSEGSRVGHGALLGPTAWWSTREEGSIARMQRVRRIHHDGRIEGGSAFAVHQAPVDADGQGAGTAQAEAATIGVAVALDRVSGLDWEPHGRELFAIVQALEGTSGWGR